MKKADAEYATLFAKYNRALARLRDLEEQIAGKEEAWKKIEKSYKASEAVARDLSEKILAKDPSEMVLGEGYSWGQLPSLELFQKARNSFETYNAKRTYLMLQLKDESEDRRMQIESLMDQLSEARLGSGIRVDKTTGEITEDDADTKSNDVGTSREDIEAATRRDIETKKAKSQMPGQFQDTDKAGTVQFVLTEEDKDFVEQDAIDNAEAGLTGYTVRVDAQSAPMHPSEKNRQDKNRRKASEKYAEIIDIEAVEEGMKQAEWDAMLAIGKYGVSTTPDIISTLAAKVYKNDEMAAKRTSAFLVSLQASGILEKTDLTDGIRSKLRIYVISLKGRKVYEHHFGVKPIMSEAEKIMAENDNYMHGYGIKALREVVASLVDANGAIIYPNVSMDRKENTVVLSDGKKYIPDLKAGNGIGTDFFEFEMGTTGTSDMAIKLNKMAQVTRNLHIVYPSVKALESNTVKYEEWIRNRGSKSLSGVMVFLHTSMSIKKYGVDNGWTVKYDCEKGPFQIRQDDKA